MQVLLDLMACSHWDNIVGLFWETHAGVRYFFSLSSFLFHCGFSSKWETEWSCNVRFYCPQLLFSQMMDLCLFCWKYFCLIKFTFVIDYEYKLIIWWNTLFWGIQKSTANVTKINKNLYNKYQPRRLQMMYYFNLQFTNLIYIDIYIELFLIICIVHFALIIHWKSTPPVGSR